MGAQRGRIQTHGRQQPRGIRPKSKSLCRISALRGKHANHESAIGNDRIGSHINSGKTVVITTGLLKALQGKGIDRVADVEYTGRTVITNKFAFRRIMDEEPANYYYSQSDIVLPQLAYGLVDSEEIIQSIYKDDSRYPVLLQVRSNACKWWMPSRQHNHWQ